MISKQVEQSPERWMAAALGGPGSTGALELPAAGSCPAQRQMTQLLSSLHADRTHYI